MDMQVSIIVAVARNGIIGKNNQLPWRLPADLLYFKRITTGHHIILGRRNYQSIGRPLPNRVNLVLSRNPQFFAKGCVVQPNLEKALLYAHAAGESECFIIGGAEIYRQAIPLAQKLYLTRIDADFSGNVVMPDLGGNWRQIAAEAHVPDEKNFWPYTFFIFERVPSDSADGRFLAIPNLGLETSPD